MSKYTVSFIGHRKIDTTPELKQKLLSLIENLILTKGAATFLFGSRSLFNDLCLECVTELKNVYRYIERIYVRAEFPFIDERYTAYLLNSYESTYFPENLINAQRAVYVKRNFEMIDKSDLIVFYKSNEYSKSFNSGTDVAYKHALKRKKKIINVAELC